MQVGTPSASSQPVEAAQLWPTEQRMLADLAARVPADGVIVEIGTAQGGSALIFHEVAGRRGVRVYSFDLAPSAEAYDRLRDTGVTIVAEPSLAGARAWRARGGEPIDLLFVDGSHALQHVFEDFNAWAPLLAPGGRIVFHDFDSEERGGLVHLGTEVVARAILQGGVLDDAAHVDRLLCGRIAHPSAAALAVEDCVRAFADLATEITRLRDGDYNGWVPVGDARLGALLTACVRGMAPAVRAAEDAPADRRLLMFARPLAPALAILEARGIPRAHAVVVSSLHVCYLVAHALPRARDTFLALAASRNELFRWEELLFMLDHGFGASRFPDVVDADARRDLAGLSAAVAREQVRLTMLARLAEAVTGERL